MAFRPHHTCLLLLGVVLFLSILDCILLNPYHTQLDFVEARRCSGGDVALPQHLVHLNDDGIPEESTPSQENTDHRRWSYYVCGSAQQDFPAQKINIPSKAATPEDSLEMAESRFTLNTDQTSYKLQCLSGVTRCTHAGNLDGNADKEASMALGPNQYMIQLEEDIVPGFPSKYLILLCFALILSGLFYGYRHNAEMPTPRYSPYNGVQAFFVATFLGMALGYLIYDWMPQGDGNLIPELTTSMSNMGMFIGLLGTAVFFIFLKTKYPHRVAETQQNSNNDIDDIDGIRIIDEGTDVIAVDARTAEDDDPHPPFFCKSPMKWAIILGFVLSIMAALFAMQINDIEMTMSDLSNEFTIYRLSLFHFAMMAGISEELLYRGVIQTAIGGRKKRGTRAMVGVWVAALLFAAVHIPQSLGHLFTLLPVFLVGLTSGYFRCKTQSIFPSMTMHLTYNSILLLPALFFI